MVFELGDRVLYEGQEVVLIARTNNDKLWAAAYQDGRVAMGVTSDNLSTTSELQEAKVRRAVSVMRVARSWSFAVFKEYQKYISNPDF